jgi:hypothetical protein
MSPFFYYYESIKRELKIKPIYELRWDSRAGTRPGARVPGLEMPWNPGTALL